jgi:para-nitrobenzyl esterase
MAPASTIAAVLIGAFAAFPIDAQTIAISSGSVRGGIEGPATIFKGIPYAAAPVGRYRWRAPQPVRAWRGVLDATEFGAECPQALTPNARSLPVPRQSEDCLFLNVWRPSIAAAGARLPVMVWIHGGGFLFGGGDLPIYSGESFARQGIILVTLNYRLGRFGFFGFPALSRENPAQPTGNFAYLDQLAALHWVRRNISAFGGDPANVTIFGESAGGVSVHALLASPLARGLFQKAIIESGGGRDGVLTGRPMRQNGVDPNYPVSAENIGVNFARQHGINGIDTAALARLRALSASDIVDGGRQRADPSGALTYSGPIVDGRVVPETAESAYKAGRQIRVPLMIGSNSAEVQSGYLSSKSKSELFGYFHQGRDQAASAYDPDGVVDLATLRTMAITDRVWAEPARFAANAMNAAGVPAYVYRFSYVADALRSKGQVGAPHASEIEFVFDTTKARYGAAVTSRDYALARVMNGYWTNFAKTGNPNGAGLPAWPRYDPVTDRILEFRPDGSAVGEADPAKARLDVTEKVADRVIPR